MAIIICGVLLVALGVFMIVSPRSSIKKDVEVSPEMLQQVKKSGIMEVVVGAILMIVGFILG